MMASPISTLGLRTLELIGHLGRVALFLGHIGRVAVRKPYRLRRFVNEVFDTGVLSLAIVCLSGATVGAVLGLQGYTTLSRFGATGSLGAVVGLSLVRELGPVMTALLVTGRAGSAMAAEIASMVTTGQIDGLRMMSIDPVDFVVAPKALAMLFVLPMLSALFVVFGFFGGYVVGVQLLGVDGGTYLSSLEGSIDFGDDVAQSLVKAVRDAGREAVLVPLAADRFPAPDPTGTVVAASLAVLLFDYVITALWSV